MSKRSVAAERALVNAEPDDVLARMRVANQVIHACESRGRSLPPVLASGSEGIGDDADCIPRDYVGEVTR